MSYKIKPTHPVHCVKSVQIQSFFWSVFSCIQSDYRKIRTRKNSVFRHFLRSGCLWFNWCNLMLKKIKSKDSRLAFLNLVSIVYLNMLVFTDDSSVNLRNGSSSAGDYVILLWGKENKALVLSIKTCCQKYYCSRITHPRSWFGEMHIYSKSFNLTSYKFIKLI